MAEKAKSAQKRACARARGANEIEVGDAGGGGRARRLPARLAAAAPRTAPQRRAPARACAAPARPPAHTPTRPPLPPRRGARRGRRGTRRTRGRRALPFRGFRNLPPRAARPIGRHATFADALTRNCAARGGTRRAPRRPRSEHPERCGLSSSNLIHENASNDKPLTLNRGVIWDLPAFPHPRGPKRRARRRREARLGRGAAQGRRLVGAGAAVERSCDEDTRDRGTAPARAAR